MEQSIKRKSLPSPTVTYAAHRSAAQSPLGLPSDPALAQETQSRPWVKGEEVYKSSSVPGKWKQRRLLLPLPLYLLPPHQTQNRRLVLQCYLRPREKDQKHRHGNSDIINCKTKVHIYVNFWLRKNNLDSPPPPSGHKWFSCHLQVNEGLIYVQSLPFPVMAPFKEVSHNTTIKTLRLLILN